MEIETARVGTAAALRKLERLLAAAGAGVVRHLGEGLPEQTVRARLAEVGMEPPEELIAWFAWRNGLVDPAGPGDTHLVKWMPFTLDEALQDWREHPHGTEAWEWLPGWLPIAHFGNATRLAVNCTPPQMALATLHSADPVSGYFNFDEGPAVQGLATVIGWWIEAFEQGHYRFDPAVQDWTADDWLDIAGERRMTFLV